MLAILVLAVILGCIPAAIAQAKGHSFVGWWIYGALLFIVALPHALMLKAEQSPEPAALPPPPPFTPADTVKTCPFCAETIKREAVVCRYCGRDIPQAALAEPAAAEPEQGATPSESPVAAEPPLFAPPPRSRGATDNRPLLLIGGAVVGAVILAVVIAGHSGPGGARSGAAASDQTSDSSNDTPTEAAGPDKISRIRSLNTLLSLQVRPCGKGQSAVIAALEGSSMSELVTAADSAESECRAAATALREQNVAGLPADLRAGLRDIEQAIDTEAEGLRGLAAAGRSQSGVKPKARRAARTYIRGGRMLTAASDRYFAAVRRAGVTANPE